jgi:hypothetical protein
MAMHIVMTSRRSMPSSVQSPYINVAVVQLTQHYTAHGLRPKMISHRARGVLRVIPIGHAPANGKTNKSGRVQLLAQAEALALQLNSARSVAEGELLITGACA